MSATQQDLTVDSTNFTAKRESHDILVTGKATGDYRVESVTLVKAHRQPSPEVLELMVEAKLGPVENPHTEILKNFNLSFTERPANRTTKVKVVNGHHHFTIEVT